MDTRLFFVVISPETNEEIFETYEEASHYCNSLMNHKARIRIAMVKNSYKENDGSWNYEDLADTFDYDLVKTF